MLPLVTDKDKILFFTHAKFIQEGFYKTTMDEIARDLQMSKKTIYKYFPSKNELLEAVCDMRIDTMQTKMNEIIILSDYKLLIIVKKLRNGISY